MLKEKSHWQRLCCAEAIATGLLRDIWFGPVLSGLPSDRPPWSPTTDQDHEKKNEPIRSKNCKRYRSRDYVIAHVTLSIYHVITLKEALPPLACHLCCYFCCIWSLCHGVMHLFSCLIYDWNLDQKFVHPLQRRYLLSLSYPWGRIYSSPSRKLRSKLSTFDPDMQMRL